MNILKDCWHLMRPRQWVKNGFVLMGILFANAWRQPDMLRRAVIATLAFSLIASGVYVLNDLVDRKDDLNHPAKKFRPLAAGRISTTAALALFSVLWVAGAGLALLVSRAVLLILLIYVAINILYSLGLKQIVILDVFLIAAGFMLRILAGTLGIGI